LVCQGYAMAITRLGPDESPGTQARKMIIEMAYDIAKKHATEHGVDKRGDH